MKIISRELGGSIHEAKKDSDGKIKSFPVVIISQGLGNLSDKNYYSKEAILSGPAIYESKKAYIDHPTPTEDKEQPGRSVADTRGHYEDCKAVLNSEGLMELQAQFVPEQDETLISKIKHAVAYKKKYPDKDYIGISINGDGEGEEMEYDDFIKLVKPTDKEMEKISQIEGQEIKLIKKFTSAVSADLVTEAGAKGRLLQESNKRRKAMKIIEAIKMFMEGAFAGDSKIMEKAKKEIESEETEKAKQEKYMKQAKKELKKKEDESEEKYEERCEKQAEKFKKEDEEESEKKEADEKAKKESEKKKEDEEKKKKENEESEDESEDEEKKKKEAKKKKEDDDGDDDHADKDKDKALIKKMMKQMDELKKENEELKKESKKKEDSAEEKHKESANLKIELETKKRIDLVEDSLAESGLPRYATKELRGLLIEKNRSKEEISKIIEAAKTVHSKAIEQALFEGSSMGFTEISPVGDNESNDNLF